MAIVARFSQTCALLVNASVYCWGNGDNGQLGRVNKESINPAAAEVVGLAEGVQLKSESEMHCCHLLTKDVDFHVLRSSTESHR